MNQSPFKDFKSFVTLCERSMHNKSCSLYPKIPICIFGVGQFGRDICSILRNEGYEVCGFIETKPRYETMLDLPVHTWQQQLPAKESVQLVIGIFNRGMPLDEMEILAKSAGYNDTFMPWDIYAQFGQQLGWRYWLSAPSFILDNLLAIENVYLELADEKSRQCLLEICAFRIGLHNAYASFSHIDQQYFNDLTLGVLAGKKVNYVDGGAYNGDTFLSYLSTRV